MDQIVDTPSIFIFIWDVEMGNSRRFDDIQL